MSTHREVHLIVRPDGIPQAGHFALREVPTLAPGAGEIQVRVSHVSVDPAMRGWVSAVANYAEPVALDGPMRSIGVGDVTHSNDPRYAPGDVVCGLLGWREVATVGADAIWFRHDPAHGPRTRALGVLGINGITAYWGLTDVGRPLAGDTVVVSTAAGAVGSAVGQIARILGCRAVGIAGGPEKAALCRDAFGYDAAIDYKSEDVAAALAAHCPAGVNVYFDNTSGPVSDAVLPQLATGARVVICGTAAVASWDPWPRGPRPERHLLVKRAAMQGFLLFDYRDRFAEARDRLAAWLAEGRLTYREHLLDGLDAAPGAIAMLYRGENAGKLIVRVGPGD